MTSPDNHRPSYRVNMTYLLVGAALGLYYGITFHSGMSQPDYTRVLIWSAIAALVTSLIGLLRKKFGFINFMQSFGKLFLLYGLFLLGLEFRKQVDAWFGNAAVMVFSISLGALIGLIMGLQKKSV